MRVLELVPLIYIIFGAMLTYVGLSAGVPDYHVPGDYDSYLPGPLGTFEKMLKIGYDFAKTILNMAFFTYDLPGNPPGYVNAIFKGFILAPLNMLLYFAIYRFFRGVNV